MTWQYILWHMLLALHSRWLELRATSVRHVTMWWECWGRTRTVWWPCWRLSSMTLCSTGGLLMVTINLHGWTLMLGTFLFCKHKLLKFGWMGTSFSLASRTAKQTYNKHYYLINCTIHEDILYDFPESKIKSKAGEGRRSSSRVQDIGSKCFCFMYM